VEVDLPYLKVHSLGIAPKQADSNVWVSVPETTLSQIAIALPSRKISVAKIEIANAKIDVWREPDGSPNLLKLLPPAKAGASAGNAAPAAAGPPAILSVGEVAITNASIAAEDRAMKPVVKTLLSPVSLTVEGYASDKSDPLKIDARVGIGKGHVNAAGE